MKDSELTAYSLTTGKGPNTCSATVLTHDGVLVAEKGSNIDHSMATHHRQLDHSSHSWVAKPEKRLCRDANVTEFQRIRGGTPAGLKLANRSNSIAITTPTTTIMCSVTHMWITKISDPISILRTAGNG